MALPSDLPLGQSQQLKKLGFVWFAQSMADAAEAGHLHAWDGREVMFVADPDLAPRDGDCIYARPDDIADTGTSWRAVLSQYNQNPDGNRLGLLPAWRLYRNSTYEILAEHFGLDRLYILSAGWGLIPANFLTPNYDITFSTARNVQKFKRTVRVLGTNLCKFCTGCSRTQRLPSVRTTGNPR